MVVHWAGADQTASAKYYKAILDGSSDGRPLHMHSVGVAALADDEGLYAHAPLPAPEAPLDSPADPVVAAALDDGLPGDCED
eukprot:3953534-Alexandrium_andersonii.AAC.1